MRLTDWGYSSVVLRQPLHFWRGRQKAVAVSTPPWCPLVPRHNVAEDKANPAEDKDGNQYETQPIDNSPAGNPPGFVRSGDLGH